MFLILLLVVINLSSDVYSTSCGALCRILCFFWVIHGRNPDHARRCAQKAPTQRLPPVLEKAGVVSLRGDDSQSGNDSHSHSPVPAGIPKSSGNRAIDLAGT